MFVVIYKRCAQTWPPIRFELGVLFAQLLFPIQFEQQSQPLLFPVQIEQQNQPLLFPIEIEQQNQPGLNLYTSKVLLSSSN